MTRVNLRQVAVSGAYLAFVLVFVFAGAILSLGDPIAAALTDKQQRANATLGFYPSAGDYIRNLENYEEWLGRKVNVAIINHGHSAPLKWDRATNKWDTQVKGNDGKVIGWEMGSNAWAYFARPESQGKNYKSRPELTLATTMPMIPYSKGSLTDCERVAAWNSLIGKQGAYGYSQEVHNLLDARYNAVINHMLSDNPGRIIIRLAHEPDINFYPWSMRDKTPSDGCDNISQLYIEAWRYLSDKFRAASNKFRFDYQGNGSWLQTNPATGKTYMESGYPGDAYVDYIGVDVYNKDSHANVLAKLRGNRDFAKARGKQMSIPEWGLWKSGCGNNGQDDGVSTRDDEPAFLDMMYGFMTEANTPASGPGSIAYHGYFMANKCVSFFQNSFPGSEVKFKQLFSTGLPLTDVCTLPAAKKLYLEPEEGCVTGAATIRTNDPTSSGSGYVQFSND